jgi:hypothetical protein
VEVELARTGFEDLCRARYNQLRAILAPLAAASGQEETHV